MLHSSHSASDEVAANKGGLGHAMGPSSPGTWQVPSHPPSSRTAAALTLMEICTNTACPFRSRFKQERSRCAELVATNESLMQSQEYLQRQCADLQADLVRVSAEMRSMQGELRRLRDRNAEESAEANRARRYIEEDRSRLKGVGAALESELHAALEEKGLLVSQIRVLQRSLNDVMAVNEQLQHTVSLLKNPSKHLEELKQQQQRVISSARAPSLPSAWQLQRGLPTSTAALPARRADPELEPWWPERPLTLVQTTPMLSTGPRPATKLFNVLEAHDSFLRSSEAGPSRHPSKPSSGAWAVTPSAALSGDLARRGSSLAPSAPTESSGTTPSDRLGTVTSPPRSSHDPDTDIAVPLVQHGDLTEPAIPQLNDAAVPVLPPRFEQSGLVKLESPTLPTRGPGRDSPWRMTFGATAGTASVLRPIESLLPTVQRGPALKSDGGVDSQFYTEGGHTSTNGSTQVAEIATRPPVAHSEHPDSATTRWLNRVGVGNSLAKTPVSTPTALAPAPPSGEFPASEDAMASMQSALNALAEARRFLPGAAPQEPEKDAIGLEEEKSISPHPTNPNPSSVLDLQVASAHAAQWGSGLDVQRTVAPPRHGHDLAMKSSDVDGVSGEAVLGGEDLEPAAPGVRFARPGDALLGLKW